MQRVLCKIAINGWFIATNIITAASLEASIKYTRFKYQYYVLAIALVLSYLWGWHYRIRLERGKGVTESILRYYWRTRISRISSSK